MTWNMTSVATEVELTFAELGPILTRVTVEHRGWARILGRLAATIGEQRWNEAIVPER